MNSVRRLCDGDSGEVGEKGRKMPQRAAVDQEEMQLSRL